MYWGAVLKMRDLEDAGYLRSGYLSCKDDINIYYRFFTSMDEETLKYLKEKINQALIKEKVIFNIDYGLCIIKHEPIVDIIENSMTYAEMSKKLAELPYTYISTHAIKPSINIYGGKEYNEDITDDIIQPLFKYGLSDNIKLDVTKNNYYYIRSKQCEDLNNAKRAIDKLFWVKK